jgi:hypothetical protein
MITHVKILAVLNIVLGCFGILAGIALLLLMSGIGALAGFAGHDHDSIVAVPILGGIGLMLFCVTFHLLNVPFGTALGIYGLWILLSNEGQRLFLQPPPAPAPY